MKLLKFIWWLGVLVSSMGIASYFYSEKILFSKIPFPEGSLEGKIYDDLQRLNGQDKAHILKKVREVYVLDWRAHKTPISWFKLSQYSFPKNSNGKYNLQIEIFDDGERSEKSLQIFQFSFFEIEHENKVWELSLDYEIPYNQK